MEEKKDKKKQIIMGIVGVLIVIVMAGGGFILWRVGYHTGHEAGTKEQREKAETALTELGKMVVGKTNLIQALADLNEKVPTEADEENSSAYIEKLNKVIDECKNEEVKKY